MEKTLLQGCTHHPNTYATVPFSTEVHNLITQENYTSDTLSDSTVSISLILPVYKPENLELVLNHINAQSYRRFEVIIVNDYPEQHLESTIDAVFLGSDITIKYIQHDVNHGRPYTRNTGITAAEGDIIVSLDQDMIIEKDFMKKIALVFSCVDNAVLTCFKENINLDDYYKNGVQRKADIRADWRYKQPFDKTFRVLALAQNTTVPERDYFLLDETNNYQDFGSGRQIGYRDIASMVISHGLAYRKKYAIQAGGFNETIFSGWGMEDLLFGVCMINTGSYIIPMRSITSYHINHIRHGGTREKELEEFTVNLEAYLQYCTHTTHVEPYRAHILTHTSRHANISYYLAS